MISATPSRNPWPIAIVAWFIGFALCLAVFIVWAARQRQDLVAANYYENEIRYQQQLDRMNRSQSFDAEAVVTYDPAQRRIVIALPAAQSLGATGSIHLYRPSDARLDRDVPLAVNVEGVQHLAAGELRAGCWKVRVQWSSGGKDFFVERVVLIAAAAQSSSSTRTQALAINSQSWSFALR